MNAQDKVQINKIGWAAIQHKDGWWVGTKDGVTCFGEPDLAKAALTIIWQREGGNRLDYRIRVFMGADHYAGEHTPKYSVEEALARYNKSK